MEHPSGFIVYYPPSRKVFVIQSVGPETARDLVADGRKLLTYREAWLQAHSQILPVVTMSRSGRQEAIGRIFDPLSFEKTVFELIRKDFAHPPEFDEWVVRFRNCPSDYVRNPEWPQYGALMTYKALLRDARLVVAQAVGL